MERGFGGVNKQKIIKQKIKSISKAIVLKLSKGYKTVLIDAINEITMIPFITLTLVHEYNKIRIL